MKIFINKISILSLISLILFSCEKDEDRITVKQGTAPTLSTSQTTLVLNKADIDKEAVVFTWTAVPLGWSPSDYSYDKAVKYTLQVDTTGNSFSSPVSIDLGNSVEKKYTVADFNALLTGQNFDPGATGTLDFRIRSDIGPNIAPITPQLVLVADQVLAFRSTLSK